MKSEKRTAGHSAGAASDERRRIYARIAPLYDLVDLPFEYFRYRRLRRMLFSGLSGRILEVGVGTGRNMPFYPEDATVTAIDLSREMLRRAERRRARLGISVELGKRDVRDTGAPDHHFDAVVASFVFCVLAEEDVVPALRELARICKPDGEVRVLEYRRPRKGLRRMITRLWEPWVRWAFGASYDRDIESLLPAAGLECVAGRFVVDELIRYTVARPLACNRIEST